MCSGPNSTRARNDLDNMAGLLTCPIGLPPSHGRCHSDDGVQTDLSVLKGTYSSGFCSGFSPDSLFSRDATDARHGHHITFHATKLQK